MFLKIKRTLDTLWGYNATASKLKNTYLPNGPYSRFDYSKGSFTLIDTEDETVIAIGACEDPFSE